MIRVGIIGCGRILAAHLRGYRLLREAGWDDFRITALCARRADDARMYLKRGAGPPQRPAASTIAGDPLTIADEYLSDFQPDTPVEIHTDFRQMIAEAPIDAVNDFTTHALHHQIAAVAFARGKDLLTQKPMAISVAVARQMCAAAASAGRVFGVFENFHTLPETLQLRWLVQSGLLGRLQLILHGYHAAWWAPDLVVADTPWRHRLIEGGGITLDLACHFVHQMRRLAGAPTTVFGRVGILEPSRRFRAGAGSGMIDCDADDTMEAFIDFESGTRGTILASWSGHGGATLLGPGSTYYFSRGRVAATLVEGDGQEPIALSDLYARAASTERQAADFPHGLSDSFALAQLDWLEAVRDRRSPAVSGAEGLVDLATSFAILESHQAGRRVELAEIATGALRAAQLPLDRHFGFVP